MKSENTMHLSIKLKIAWNI